MSTGPQDRTKSGIRTMTSLGRKSGIRNNNYSYDSGSLKWDPIGIPWDGIRNSYDVPVGSHGIPWDPRKNNYSYDSYDSYILDPIRNYYDTGTDSKNEFTSGPNLWCLEF